MIELPMGDFRGRVLVSRERVKFADADPYGHLAAGAYVNMIMSHRVEALEDLLSFSIMRSAGSGVAFPARNIEVAYLRPAFVGDMLEVGSWLEDLGSSSFEVRAIVAGQTDRAIRALARIHFVTVDARSGKAVPVPATLPSSASRNKLLEQPRLDSYLGTVSGLPDGWSSKHAAGQ
jgi:YbgC/YbaW family acyl-CoA thioester hydrolase